MWLKCEILKIVLHIDAVASPTATTTSVLPLLLPLSSPPQQHPQPPPPPPPQQQPPPPSPPQQHPKPPALSPGLPPLVVAPGWKPRLLTLLPEASVLIAHIALTTHTMATAYLKANPTIQGPLTRFLAKGPSRDANVEAAWRHMVHLDRIDRVKKRPRERGVQQRPRVTTDGYDVVCSVAVPAKRNAAVAAAPRPSRQARAGRSSRARGRL